jgi:hypothetical protein
MTPCILDCYRWAFRGRNCLHQQGWRMGVCGGISRLRCRCTPTRLQGATSHKHGRENAKPNSFSPCTLRRMQHRDSAVRWTADLQHVTWTPCDTCSCNAQLQCLSCSPDKASVRRFICLHTYRVVTTQHWQVLTEVEDAVPLPVEWYKQDSAIHFVISVEHHGGRSNVHVKR